MRAKKGGIKLLKNKIAGMVGVIGGHLCRGSYSQVFCRIAPLKILCNSQELCNASF